MSQFYVVRFLTAAFLILSLPVTVFAKDGGGSGSGDDDPPFALMDPSNKMDYFHRALILFDQGTVPELGKAKDESNPANRIPVNGVLLGGVSILNIGEPGSSQVFVD